MALLNFKRRPQNELELGGRQRIEMDQSDPEMTCPNCRKSSPSSAVWQNFNNFPPLYQRVRIDTIQIKKKQPDLYNSRLQKFIENGFQREKCIHIPTLFNDTVLRKDLKIEYRPFALFIGRTDPDKGLMTMLDAFIGTKYNLKITCNSTRSLNI